MVFLAVTEIVAAVAVVVGRRPRDVSQSAAAVVAVVVVAVGMVVEQFCSSYGGGCLHWAPSGVARRLAGRQGLWGKGAMSSKLPPPARPRRARLTMPMDAPGMVQLAEEVAAHGCIVHHDEHDVLTIIGPPGGWDGFFFVDAMVGVAIDLACDSGLIEGTEELEPPVFDLCPMGGLPPLGGLSPPPEVGSPPGAGSGVGGLSPSAAGTERGASSSTVGPGGLSPTLPGLAGPTPPDSAGLPRAPPDLGGLPPAPPDMGGLSPTPLGFIVQDAMALVQETRLWAGGWELSGISLRYATRRDGWSWVAMMCDSWAPVPPPLGRPVPDDSSIQQLPRGLHGDAHFTLMYSPPGVSPEVVVEAMRVRLERMEGRLTPFHARFAGEIFGFGRNYCCTHLHIASRMHTVLHALCDAGLATPRAHVGPAPIRWRKHDFFHMSVRSAGGPDSDHVMSTAMILDLTDG